MVNDIVWQEIEKWIKTTTEPYENITLIGSGGTSTRFLNFPENTG